MSIFPGHRPGRLLGLLALAVLLPAVGCSRSTGSVKGTVNLKGTNLKGGHVVFTPGDGTGPYSAEIGEDGSYTLEKCPVGPMKVSVQTAYMKPREGGFKYEPPKDAPAVQGGAAYKPPDQSGNAVRYISIPAKYETPDSSGLKFEVKGGSQTYAITLE